MLGCCCRIDIR